MGAAGTTVRIREETRETLRDLERETGEKTPDLLARAVEQFYRSLLIAETNCGYAALRSDEAAWREEQQERAEFEGTIADGLD